MKQFQVNNQNVGGDAPCYVIAEVSCNHEGDIDSSETSLSVLSG